MKNDLWGIMIGIMAVLGSSGLPVEALMEEGQTVIYVMTHHTATGDLESFTAYSVAGFSDSAYWLQRTTHVSQPETKPLSITQTLLDSTTHEPLRYIMFRPANMSRPAHVIDLPLERMGKDEVLPTPVTEAFSKGGVVDVPAGQFATQTARLEKFSFWVNPDVPVLGVVRVEAPDWTMELYRIDSQAKDLFPQKPPKGGRVYLKEE